MQAEHRPRPLVFSIAFNGYQWLYQRNIRTHRAYANQHGFDYVLVDDPPVTGLFMECCWVKLPLIMSALAQGRDWVFFIDADAEIRSTCPDFRSLAKSGKSLYMAHGFSGRVNSGVIIVRNSPEIREFLATVVSGFAKVIPPADDVGWGENGHIIHFTRNAPFLEVIPPAWNNNHSPELADHVRHYSAGPMRKLYRMNTLSRAFPSLSAKAQRAASRFGVYRYTPDKFPDRLMGLYRTSVSRNNRFFKELKKTEIFGSASLYSS